MNKEYRKIINHYESCLKRHGDTAKGVDWPNEEDAFVRYSIMLQVIIKNKKCTLLDFGCGTAKLYDYIAKNSSLEIDYTGLDFSEMFINVCKTKYPHLKFLCQDIITNHKQLNSYDYIIMNGVFTEKLDISFDNMFTYFKKMISLLYRKANIAIAFNVMTKHVDWERNDLFHLPFDSLVTFLKSEISRNFIIRNDYGLYEYTVYVFREPNKWQK